LGFGVGYQGFVGFHRGCAADGCVLFAYFLHVQGVDLLSPTSTSENARSCRAPPPPHVSTPAPCPCRYVGYVDFPDEASATSARNYYRGYKLADQDGPGLSLEVSEMLSEIHAKQNKKNPQTPFSLSMWRTRPKRILSRGGRGAPSATSSVRVTSRCGHACFPFSDKDIPASHLLTQ